MVIFEAKCEKPIGFDISKEKFYILDHKKKSFPDVKNEVAP